VPSILELVTNIISNEIKEKLAQKWLKDHDGSMKDEMAEWLYANALNVNEQHTALRDELKKVAVHAKPAPCVDDMDEAHVSAATEPEPVSEKPPEGAAQPPEEADKTQASASQSSDDDASDIPSAEAKRIQNKLKDLMDDAAWTKEKKQQATLRDRYLKDFEVLWGPVEADLKSFIQAYDIKQLETAFLARHPWIQDESLQIKFYTQWLIKVLKLDDDTWQAISVQELRDKPLGIRFEHLLTKHSTDDALGAAIAAYPIQNLDAILGIESDTMPKLHHQIEAHQLGKLNKLVLYPLDVLQLLTRVYPEQIKPVQGKKRVLTKIATLHHQALSDLIHAELSALNLIILNIATQEKPQWVLLQRSGINGWKLYSPEIKTYPKIPKMPKNIKGVEQVKVDMRCHQALDDLQICNDDLAWHAVLFARVIPGCLQSKPVSAFLNTLPLPSMLEYLLWHVMPDSRAGSDKQTMIHASFLMRSPLRTLSVHHTMLQQEQMGLDSVECPSNYNRFLGESDVCSANTDFLFPKNLSAYPTIYQRLVDDLLAQHLVIDAEDVSLTFNLDRNNDKEMDNLTEVHEAYYAMLLMVHYYHINQIQFKGSKHVTGTRVFDKLIEHNLDLLTVYPIDPGSHYTLIHAASCAARNRFLVSNADEEQLKLIRSNTKQFPMVTGQAMIEFYTSHGKSIDLDFIKDMSALKTKWYEANCSHKMKDELKAADVTWQFLQIAQMGALGLNMFFHSAGDLNFHPGEGLFLTFDIDGKTLDPISYIHELHEKISRYTRPLLKQLSIVLPDTFDASLDSKLVGLLSLLDQRNVQFGTETEAFLIHELKISNHSQAHRVLDALEAYVQAASACTLIILPTWDVEAFSAVQIAPNQLKAQYRRIQNIIYNNRRALEHAKLTEKTQNIYFCAENTLLPDMILNPSVRAKKRAPSKDKISLLTRSVPGLQQQLQLGQKQEMSLQQGQARQAQETQQMQAKTKVDEIGAYAGDLDTLISRDNIINKWPDFWPTLPPETQKAIDLKFRGLIGLFSMVVGSKRNAAHVIQYIEPSAFNKILEHRSQFNLSISKENLPAGFFLCHANDQGLTLHFDEKLEQQMLNKQALTPIGQRTPFTVMLQHPLSARPWEGGDYSQFSCFTEDPHEQATLWRHLVGPHHSQMQIKNARAVLGHSAAKDDQDVYGQMQKIILGAKPSKPGDFATAILILHDWAKKIPGIDPAMLDTLFDQKKFTPENALAFGQLFHASDVCQPQDKAADTTGSQHFIFIANQIYSAFGAEQFIIWKKRLVDPSKNLTACLEKEEVDALALSVTILKDKPEIKSLWWQLVDAHGKSLGQMQYAPLQYAPLWYAFYQLIQLMEQKKYTLNVALFKQYVAKKALFHGQVWLERLVFCLKHAEKNLPSHAIQRHILDQVAKIDWCHDGLYYAIRYEGFAGFWHESLQLSEFKGAQTITDPKYTSDWSDLSVMDAKIEVVATRMLRCISQSMQVSHEEFSELVEQGGSQYLVKLLSALECFQDKSFRLDIVRIFLISVTLGPDRTPLMALETMLSLCEMFFYSEKHFLLPFFQRLSQCYSLDVKQCSGPWLIRLSQLKKLLRALTAEQVKKMESKSNEQLLTWLNACAAAMAYFDSVEYPNDKLMRLLDQVTAAGDLFCTHMLFTFPWLVNADPLPEAEVALLRSPEWVVLTKQMQSIDFEKSKTSLPSPDEITALIHKFSEAHTRSDAADVRRAFICQQLEKGCVIAYQSTVFRCMTEAECEALQVIISKNTKPRFSAQNLHLYEMFFRNHLAITAVDGDSEYVELSLLEPLLSCFQSIDNKDYFNDLGQVLGELIHAAKQSKARYALPQLLGWLKVLSGTTHEPHRHFPVYLLKEILAVANEGQNDHLRGLLSGNLEQLKTSVSDDHRILQQNIQALHALKLPNQYKPVLARFMLQNEHETWIRKVMDALVDIQTCGDWLDGVHELLLVMSKASQKLNIHTVIELVSKQCALQQPASAALWKDSQAVLSRWIAKNVSNLNDDMLNVFNADHLDGEKAPHIVMILVQSMQDEPVERFAQLSELKQALERLSPDALCSLAQYYTTKPKPSVPVLLRLLQKHETTREIIHHFETVEQAMNEGKPKRQYSISAQDKIELSRILTGMVRINHKRNQHIQQKLLSLLYYSNTYAVLSKIVSRYSEDLCSLLYENIEALRTATTESKKENCMTQMLTCVREIVLRQTGTWANHTQMLALLYAGLHNDEHLIHQIHTGQGKSIIALMRTSFLALTGKIVDLFSAKESLSYRDYETFSHVLHAMKIPNAYICASSPAEAYQTHQTMVGETKTLVGAVHYATIGHFSLFLAAQAWSGNAMTLERNHRIAFLDEIDYTLLDEITQFNFADSRQKTAVYNFDAWAYEVIDQFYVEHKARLHEGVSHNSHLEVLSQRLTDAACFSHAKSTFYDTHLKPALSGNDEAIKKRNDHLLVLLCAAYIAHDVLKEGISFCVRRETRPLAYEQVMKMRLAKVLIANQVMHGTTYSGGVQQMLHVCLNALAVKQGEAPDFFIEPESKIAISLNVGYLLRRYYHQLEGCTGTVGDGRDLKSYEKHFGIQHVVKLPPHEKSKTEFLPPHYAKSFDAQMEAIAEVILKRAGGPMLVTCANDIEVKAISLAVRKILQKRDYNFDGWIVDTNDSGVSESAVVPLVGRENAVTFSSRMGRGTDIKPQNRTALMVLRTYPGTPRIIEQEFGRQGRNGDHGTCLTILNAEAITKEWDACPAHLQTQMSTFFQSERVKFKKACVSDSDTYKWAEDEEVTDAHVSLPILLLAKSQYKREHEQALRLKEAWMAVISGQMMDKCFELAVQNAVKRDDLYDRWLVCKQEIESTWGLLLAEKGQDQWSVFLQFKVQAQKIWEAFADLNAIDKTLSFSSHDEQDRTSTVQDGMEEDLRVEEHTDKDEKHQDEMLEMVSFYQRWMAGAKESYPDDQSYDPDDPFDPYDLLASSTIHGDGHGGSHALFNVFMEIGQSKNVKMRKACLLAFPEQFPPVLYYMPHQALAETIHQLTKLNTDYFKLIRWFFTDSFEIKKFSANNIGRYQVLFKLVTEIVFSVNVASLTQDYWGSFIQAFCQEITSNHWDHLDDSAFLNHTRSIFTSAPALTSLLAENMNPDDLRRTFHLIQQNMRLERDTSRQRCLQLSNYARTFTSQSGPLLPIWSMAAQLTLGSLKEHYLPPLDCLEAATSDQKIAFFDFLTHRLPIRQEACDALITTFNNNQKNWTSFTTLVFEPLCKLPDHIAIDYIVQHLKPCVGQLGNYMPCRRVLENIDCAAQAFNGYLSAMNLTEKDTCLEDDEGMTGSFEDWLKLFHQMSPEKNNVFFRLLNKHALGVSTLQFSYLNYLAQSWLKGTIGNEVTLELHLTIAMTSTQAWGSMSDDLQTILLETLASSDDSPMPACLNQLLMSACSQEFARQRMLFEALSVVDPLSLDRAHLIQVIREWKDKQIKSESELIAKIKHGASQPLVHLSAPANLEAVSLKMDEDEDDENEDALAKLWGVATAGQAAGGHTTVGTQYEEPSASHDTSAGPCPLMLNADQQSQFLRMLSNFSAPVPRSDAATAPCQQVADGTGNVSRTQGTAAGSAGFFGRSLPHAQSAIPYHPELPTVDGLLSRTRTAVNWSLAPPPGTNSQFDYERELS
jgi:hypothetical protein